MGLLTPVARPHPFPETFVPPLENGDHLTRAEFERRYNAMPEHVRAELVEGVVVMASPVRFTLHGQQHADNERAGMQDAERDQRERQLADAGA